MSDEHQAVPEPTQTPEEVIRQVQALLMRAESVERTLLTHAAAVDRSATTRANAAIILCVAAFVTGVVVNALMYASLNHDNLLKHSWLEELQQKNPDLVMPATPPEWGGDK